MQTFLFLDRKVKSLFHQRKRPAKIAWTTTYRKQHRKVCLLFHTTEILLSYNPQNPLTFLRLKPPCTGPRGACHAEEEESHYPRPGSCNFRRNFGGKTPFVCLPHQKALAHLLAGSWCTFRFLTSGALKSQQSARPPAKRRSGKYLRLACCSSSHIDANHLFPALALL